MSLTGIKLAIAIRLFYIISYCITTKLAQRFTRRALIQKHECQEPPALNLDLDSINREATEDHKLLETTTRLFKEHGNTYKATRAGRTVIRTCDPEVTKAVLPTHLENFGVQPIRYEGGKGFFGNGMLVVDGQQWKHSRALIRPAFDIAHVTNFDRLSGHVQRFMDLLPRDGSTIDLFPLLKRMVSATRLVHGTLCDDLLTRNRHWTFQANSSLAAR